MQILFERVGGFFFLSFFPLILKKKKSNWEKPANKFWVRKN